MRGVGTRLAGGLVPALLLLACRPVPETPSSAVPAPPRVEYAGCATVREGPVCVLGASRTLRLWVEDAGAPLDVAVGQLRTPTDAGEAVASGRRLEIEIPASARRVTVERPRSETALWRLDLAPPEQRSWTERFRKLARDGEWTAARSLAVEMSEAPDPVDRALAHTWLRRLSYNEGRADAFVTHARAAAEAHGAVGRRQDRVDEVTAWAFHLLEEGRFAEARRVLDRLDVRPGDSAEMSVRGAYFSGLWAEQVGDARTALRALSAAALTAERVGLDGEHRAALQVLARELQRMGRVEDASAVFERLRALPTGDPCSRAQLAINEGWTWWLIRDAGGEAPDPIPRYEEALTVYRDASAGCPRADDEIRNLELNLALAHVSADRPAAARRALGGARPVAETPDSVPLRLWRLDLDGRLALAEHRPEAALGHYERLARLADSIALPEARWRAAVGRAHAHRLLGDRSAALAELASAETLVEREVLRVPLAEGRGTFVAQREAASRWWVELLLEEGRPRDALDVARRSRNRVLQGLHRGDRLAALDPPDRRRWAGLMERHGRLRAELDASVADWTLSVRDLERAERRRGELRRELTRTLDDAFRLLGHEVTRRLPELSPDELVLAAHPLPGGWAIFGASGDRVAVHRVAASNPWTLPPARLADHLLAPFVELLEDTTRVRILPYGKLREVDVHALPWRDGNLLDSVPVVYGLDLSPETSRSPGSTPDRPARVLAVADPEGNLPQARREVERVSAAFARTRGDVRRLEGREATGAAVRHELSEVDVFHYAGHGASRGLGGWESALMLADGGRLTVGDVLALPRLPAWVVLSGCETGRTADPSPVETLGLAQAFAAAGSRGVVATSRPVSDVAARELVDAFYAAWDGRSDPAEPLRQAQLALRKSRPEEWAAFRLVTP